MTARHYGSESTVVVSRSGQSKATGIANRVQLNGRRVVVVRPSTSHTGLTNKQSQNDAEPIIVNYVQRRRGVAQLCLAQAMPSGNKQKRVLHSAESQSLLCFSKLRKLEVARHGGH